VWDAKSWDKDTIVQVLNQFAACTSSEIWSVMMFCHNDDTRKFKEAFDDYGLVNIDTVYWYKEGYNAEGNKWQFLPAVETIVMGHFRKGATGGLGYNMDDNPLNRHNIIIMPPVGAGHRKCFLGGDYVNVCEKPAEMGKWFCSRFVEPEGHVIVGCAGSGGEVQGCLEAGRHVVAVEMDSKQADFMSGYFGQLDINKQLAKEQQEAKDAKALDKERDSLDVQDKDAVKDDDCPACGCELGSEGQLLLCECGLNYCNLCGDRPDSCVPGERFEALKCSPECKGPVVWDKPAENDAEDIVDVIF
jgi:hypothetical protein